MHSASALSPPLEFLKSLARYSHLLLIATMGSVLVILILPVPSGFLDFFLAINLVGTLAILLVAISVHHPMKITTFPTILLIATLFRLGLNISSTRLILTEASAGHIIQTFGEFATGGNLLVGILVFAILTLIQFIVIAKGAERIAEVAARFSLDAMPGKQMSIDADLRAGQITQAEARAQRESLHKESKLYGAMDGAMKFVKGDAIAGICITFINILGGLAAGVFQQGYSLSQSLSVYSKLTIGDGLVNQIPALLMAMTAGFIVTRVADEKNETSLGADIGLQVLSQPKALIGASVLAFLIGFIPGFPLILFTVISLALGGLGAAIIFNIRKKLSAPPMIDSFRLSDDPGGGIHESPFVLSVSEELHRVFRSDPRWQIFFGSIYPKLRQFMTQQMGVPFPELHYQIKTTLKGSFRYDLEIHGTPVEQGILHPSHCAILGDIGEAATTQAHTAHGTKLNFWKVEETKELVKKGLQPYQPEEMLLRHLARTLKRHAAEFLDLQEMRNLLNMAEAHYPDLVLEVVPKMMTIQKLTEVAKRLVEEGIPLKNLRGILQILASSQPETKDVVSLTEQVRVGLRRSITASFARDQKLIAWTLAGEIEDEIRASIQKEGGECYLALPPDRVENLLKSFSVMDPSHKVILTSIDIRRYIRKMIEVTHPDVHVLSYQELDPRVTIQSFGEITTA